MRTFIRDTESMLCSFGFRSHEESRGLSNFETRVFEFMILTEEILGLVSYVSDYPFDLQMSTPGYTLCYEPWNHVRSGNSLVQKRKSQNINLISHMPCTSPFSKYAIRSETEVLSARNMYRDIESTC